MSTSEFLQCSLAQVGRDGLTEAFEDARPKFISMQGQHRHAAMNVAVGPSMGLPRVRGGDLGSEGLFPNGKKATPSLKIGLISLVDHFCLQQRSVPQTETKG